MKTFMKLPNTEERLIDAPGIDLTLPRHNYIGPGTKVIDKIMSGVMPVDKADLLSMQHDFDYLLANNEKDIRQADVKFYSQSNDLESVAASLALELKHQIGFDPMFVNDKRLTTLEIQRLQNMLDKLKYDYERSQAGGATDDW